MNRADNLHALVKVALLGLEDLIPGGRARISPRSFELVYRLENSSLESRFVLVYSEEHEALQQAFEFGQTVVDSTGIDSSHIHCCIIPFTGGLLYLDRKEPFSEEQVALAGMVCHQLVANMLATSSGLVRAQRGSVKDLPEESWLHNQLHKYDQFSIIQLEIDHFQQFKDQRGWEAGDSALRELTAFLSQRLEESDLLAKCEAGRFLLLTNRVDKSEITKFWQAALRRFEEMGVAKLYNLTLSAGVAVFPEDGDRYTVRALADEACARAARLGDRVVTVASSALAEVSLKGDPRTMFDSRSFAIVAAATQECQVRHRLVDATAIVWGMLREAGSFSQLLKDSGLDIPLFREKLLEGGAGIIDFADSAFKAFSLSLEFAHRSGKTTIGVEELFLACLAERETEKALRESGMEFGQVLVGLYREGVFAGSDTFLVGDLRTPSQPGPRLQPKSLPRTPPQRRLSQAFGQNFSADAWELLAAARAEAKDARHHLGFPHLYIACLVLDEASVENERMALKGLDLEDVAPEACMTDRTVLDFLGELDREFERVTAATIKARLLKHPRVLAFMAQVEE